MMLLLLLLLSVYICDYTCTLQQACYVVVACNKVYKVQNKVRYSKPDLVNHDLTLIENTFSCKCERTPSLTARKDTLYVNVIKTIV